MKASVLYHSEILAPDGSQEIRQELLRHWGEDEAVCVGHAYDGVLWGRIGHGQLRIPHDISPGQGAQLRWATLLDLRIFNEKKELRIWRSDSSFKAVRLTDSESAGSQDHGTAAQEVYALDRAYELIRSPKTSEKPATQANEFVALKGLAGQLHYPPGPSPEKLRARLYYQADPSTGLVRCIDNRLLGLVSGRSGK